METQPNWVIADWLRLMEPARGESCLSGQRRGPAAPGGDRVLSPDYKSFHISTTPTTRGQKRRSPGSIPPRRVWKPQPNCLVANCQGFSWFIDGTALTVPTRRDGKTVVKMEPWSHQQFHLPLTRTVPSRRENLSRCTVPSRPVEKISPYRPVPHS